MGATDRNVGFISDNDIDQHDAAVRALTSDIDNVSSKDRSIRPKGIQSFKLSRWTPYVMKWNQWVKDHTGFVSRFDDSGFAALKLEYGQLRNEWTKELRQPTDSPDSTPGSPSTGRKDAMQWLPAVAVGAGLGIVAAITLAVIRR